MSEFVHLHLHSEYSLLDGACRTSDIPKAAKAAGHKAVALTDHGVMYGAVAFYKACLNEGVKPIIGCEVYVAPRTRFDKTHEYDSERYHLVLLVKNETGYKNLIYMVSKGFTEGFYSKPSVDLDLLSRHSEGLIALSACLGGYIPQQILNGSYKKAKEYALKLNGIFGEGNFYLELQNHCIEGEDRVIAGLVQLASETGIPLAATNDAHYISRSDAETQAILMCIQTNSEIADGRPLGFETDEFYYKSTEEMCGLFGQYPGAIENTVRIAGMCNFDFDFKTLYLPAFTPPDGISPPDYLRAQTERGLEYRLQEGDIPSGTELSVYRERIEYELKVIISMGYAEYFLIVSDFVNYAKSQNIPVGPGRGSGAGCLVAYLLRITDVDPVKYDLLFEAFLNPERVSMPDFDIDFCYDRRDEVIKYVADRYGKDHVSQIITFGTMAARQAVRDVGRALSMSYSEVDLIAKLIPQRLGITLSGAMESEELKNLYNESERVKLLLDTAKALEGMPRHASTHAAGVVITDEPVYSYVPLAGTDGSIVTQFDMDTIAALGLLKFDFLGLRYLTIISDTVKQINEAEPEFDIRSIPEDDIGTYEQISSGHTDGMFQLESGGMKQMLMSLAPRSLEDIMTAIALYRPGPMDSIPKFIENRRDPSKIHYDIPELAQILDETYGCIVYQEQVTKIFRSVAGYTYGRADIVRRAISKKKAGVLEQERDNFLAGAQARNVSRDNALSLFEEMTGFANYGFKKSHAAAYAVLSFRTAYLRTHYPAMYISSLLTSVLGNTSKMAQYVAEANRCGIKLLPPDINESRMLFCVSGHDIRFGLLAVKSVGQPFIKAIIDERSRAGKFTSFFSFAERMRGIEGNKRQVEALIMSGAFDSLGVYRSRLMAGYEKIIDSVSARNKKNVEGQISFFDIAGESENSFGGFKYPEIPDLSLKDKLYAEKMSSGIYFSGHMLDDYSKHAELAKAASLNMIIGEDAVYHEQDRVTAAVIVTKRSDKMTKKGDNMAFLTVEDRFAETEVIVFPKTLEQYGGILMPDNAVLITGVISIKDDEDPKILLNSASLMKNNDDITAHETERMRKIYIKVPDMECEAFLKAMNLIEIFDGPLPAVFYDSSKQKYIKTNLGVYAGETVLNALKAAVGAENVVIK